MMLSTAFSPVFGITAETAAVAAVRVESSSGMGQENSFARMVALYQGNSHLFDELKAVRSQLSRTRKYLAIPGSHLALGAAHLLRLQARHAAALALLRSNRVEARGLFARLDAVSDA